MKKQNGNTLIALIITIIVMLILAGVAISLVTGENGVITQAENSKTAQANAVEADRVGLAILDAKTSNLSSVTGEPKFNETLIKKAVEKEFGTGKCSDVTTEGEFFVFTIIESGNKYKVDKIGKLTRIETNSNKPNGDENNNNQNTIGGGNNSGDDNQNTVIPPEPPTEDDYVTTTVQSEDWSRRGFEVTGQQIYVQYDKEYSNLSLNVGGRIGYVLKIYSNGGLYNSFEAATDIEGQDISTQNIDFFIDNNYATVSSNFMSYFVDSSKEDGYVGIQFKSGGVADVYWSNNLMTGPEADKYVGTISVAE